MRRVLRGGSGALAVAAAFSCSDSDGGGVLVQIELSGRGSVGFGRIEGGCDWNDADPCSVSHGAAIEAFAIPEDDSEDDSEDDWGFVAWEDGASPAERGREDYGACESSTPQITFAPADGDEPRRIYRCRVVFLPRRSDESDVLDVPLSSNPPSPVMPGTDVTIRANLPESLPLIYVWSDGTRGPDRTLELTDLDASTTVSVDVFRGDALFGRGELAVTVRESSGDLPVDIAWDDGGRVEIRGDVTESSSGPRAWSGTVPSGGRLELSAIVLDPEDDAIGFLGWREGADCSLPDLSVPEAVISSVTQRVDCYAEFGTPTSPCGDLDPTTVEVDFTVDGIPWDGMPTEDPPVYDAADPTDIELVATVEGVSEELLVYDWEVKPFDAMQDPPWLDLQQCGVTETRCTLDGTMVRWNDQVVNAGLIRLGVRGCAGEIDSTVGPTQDADAVPTYVDFFP